jgi:hypothetical protein
VNVFSWYGVVTFFISVHVIASASVASTGGFCITILVPSYCKPTIVVAGISPVTGSDHASVFMFLAHSQFTLIVQAPVLATSVLNDICIPVVYAANAGVIVTT